MPKRVQLRRTKGWRKPEGVVIVARPTRWGNPYMPDFGFGGTGGPNEFTVQSREEALERYRAWLTETTVGQAIALAARQCLEGRDLACWCPLDQPCHADVLLELANAPPSQVSTNEVSQSPAAGRRTNASTGR